LPARFHTISHAAVISPLEAGCAAFSVEMIDLGVVISTERSERRDYFGAGTKIGQSTEGSRYKKSLSSEEANLIWEYHLICQIALPELAPCRRVAEVSTGRSLHLSG
jgi:hypothetical protein